LFNFLRSSSLAPKKKEDLAVLQKLQEHVWDCLHKATMLRRKYATGIDLAQELDDHLLS